MSGDSTELSQEGLIVPPIRFVHKGKIENDIAAMITANVRTPEISIGDLRAQMAANILGRRRLLELVEKYGLETLHDSMEEVMDYSERMTRSAIRRMPKGRCEAEDFLDDAGLGGRPIKIRVAISIGEDSIKIDFTGTDRQVEGPLNAVWGVTIAGVYYVVKCVTDPAIPTNDGSFRPIEAHAPVGSIVNPTRPAPVAGGNVETSQRNVDVLLKAFSRIVPERVCAACQGTMNNVSVGGIDPKTGRPWSFYETIGGGFGGRVGLDGVDAIHSHMTNTMNTPIEVIEAVYPIRFTSYKMRADSGGPGEWRGGVGLERRWMLNAPTATLSILAERNKLPPWGLFGGAPGARGQYYLVASNGRKRKLGSKCTVRMKGGDSLVVRTPGGGGYGDPLEREPRAVLEDVANGLVSQGSARDDYGVVIHGEILGIDSKATAQLRKRMRSGPRLHP